MDNGQPNEMPNSDEAPLSMPEPTIQKLPKSKMKLWIIGAVAALLIAGGLLWYFELREKDTTSPQANQNNNSDGSNSQTEQLQGLPDLVAYAHRDNDKDPYKLFTRPATGGDRTEVMTLPANMYISYYVVQGNQVAFVLEPGENAADKLTIYYSSDAGKSYSKIYTSSSDIDDNSGIGEQVSSLVFSSDGKSLVIGLLPSIIGGNNQVTEIALTGSNETKTLFTSDKAGVFLQGYDRTKQRAVYFTGCYNCDGNVSNPLFVRDGNGAESVLYESEVGFLNVAVKSDFNSVVISEGTHDPAVEGLGETTKAPYTIFNLDIASKEKKTLGTISESNVLDVGYGATGDPYVATYKKVVSFAGKTSTLFETSSSIYYGGVPFVGKDSVVVLIGSQTSADFTLNYFKVGEAEPVKLLSGDGNTVILGVTQK
jgi:hypothetical protein